MVIRDNIENYLSVSKYINWKDSGILSKADGFKQKYTDEIALTKAVYEFVRDDIRHLWDTCRYWKKYGCTVYVSELFAGSYF